ncbi:MAG: CHAT domain-containing protein [Acidobacteriota bacterium]|nr:CHAT domain-containing protein [Acidobacteriota bacterium]
MRVMLALALLLFTATAESQPASKEPLAGVAMEVFNGRHRQARPAIEKALAAYRAASDAGGEGVSLLLLGLADVADEKLDDGRGHLDAGIAKLRETGDFMTAFIGLMALAELETNLGRTAAAVERHRQAVEAIEEASQPAARFTLAGFKVMAPAVGMDASMLGPLLANPEIMKPIMLMIADAMARESYARVLIDLGKLDDAERELRQAATSAAMFGGMFDSAIEADYGNLRRRQWRFDDARAHYRNAMRAITPLPMIASRDEWLNVRMLVHLSEIEELSGCTNEALAWNDKALAMVRASKNWKREAYLLDTRGGLLVNSSRFTEAEAAFVDALAIAETIGDVYQQASLLSSLGNLYFTRGELGKAASTLEQSVAMYQKTKAQAAEASTWLLLAEVYISLDTLDAAKTALENTRALSKKSDFALAGELANAVEAMGDWVADKRSLRDVHDTFSRWWELPETGDLMIPEDLRMIVREMAGIAGEAELESRSASVAQLPNVAGMVHLLRGKKLFQQGDIAGARALWLKAVESNASRDLRAPYLAAVAMSYWQQGKKDEAVARFQEAVQAVGAAIEDVKVEEMVASYLGSQRRWFFDIAIQMLIGQGKFEEAFDYSERARSRAFLQSIGNTRLQPARGASADLVAEAEALRRRIAEWERESAFKSREVAEDLRQARERYATFLKRVKVSNPEYASLTSVEPMRLGDLQHELPADTAAISFFVERDVVHAWIIQRDKFKYVPLAASGAQLERAVCWAAQLGGGSGTARSMTPASGDCANAATAEEAYELLFAPLREHVGSARLILIPHGVLHYIPFAALRNGATNRYLLEDYTIVYSPSASALRFLRAKETPVNGGALVIGDPEAAKGRLPGAEREATAIAKAFATTAKTGADATEDLLYGLGGKYDLVHIGAHATYDARTPLFSRIALAAHGEYDGNVDLHEILASVDFSGVNLVVLSACGTARGARSGGDEIVGLTRAVLYAGTPGAISTLWDIDDDASADLMQDFYARLLGGAAAADALREAQIAMMKRAPYADPRFWAAFQLSGNPQGRWRAQTRAH